MTYSNRFENSANEEQQPPGRSHRSGGYDRDNMQVKAHKAFLWFTTASAITAIAFTITFAVKADVVKPGDEGFSLYKNSRFRECAARNVDNINCTSILERKKLLPQDDKSNSTDKTIGLSYFSWNDKTDTDFWCDIVGCLPDYQIVPTIPADDATTSSILLVWVGFIQVSLFTIYASIAQSGFNPHFPKECTEKSVFMWFGAIYSTLSMVWWWVKFIRMGGSPLVAYGMSPLNWVSTWRAAQAFNCHPVACNFHNRTTTRKLIWGVLFAVTTAQLGATIYIVHLSYSHFTFATFYQFLEDEYTNTPGGTSPCTAAEIRNNPDLFGYRSLGNSFEYMKVEVVKTSFFAYLAGVTILEMILTLWYTIKVRASRSGDNYARLGMFARSMITTVIVGFIAYAAIRSSVFFLQTANREAPFELDHTCKIIHIALSGWRHFFGVDGNKAVKVIAGILNVAN